MYSSLLKIIIPDRQRKTMGLWLNNVRFNNVRFLTRFKRDRRQKERSDLTKAGPHLFTSRGHILIHVCSSETPTEKDGCNQGRNDGNKRISFFLQCLPSGIAFPGRMGGWQCSLLGGIQRKDFQPQCWWGLGQEFFGAGWDQSHGRKHCQS